MILYKGVEINWWPSFSTGLFVVEMDGRTCMSTSVEECQEFIDARRGLSEAEKDLIWQLSWSPLTTETDFFWALAIVHGLLGLKMPAEADIPWTKELAEALLKKPAVLS